MLIGIEFDMIRFSILVIWLTRGKTPMACADSNFVLRRFVVLRGPSENFGLHDKALVSEASITAIQKLNG
jgi:hypothetical protein